MTFRIACLACLLACLWLPGRARSQSDLIEAARESAIAGLPRLQEAGSPAVSMLESVDTTALGCGLIAGTPLARPIEALRIEFPLGDHSYSVHVSADGRMTQLCDARFPGLGAGLIPQRHPQLDRDGDGLPDAEDRCPWIAGLADESGCPLIRDGDRDGDGAIDAEDLCPAQAGSAAADGCSLLPDDDGDGAPDSIDICPIDPGLVSEDFALGCPADGSGRSTRIRDEADICRVVANGVALHASPDEASALLGIFNASVAPAGTETVLGRTAAGWLQLAQGWIAPGPRLAGACYNLPLELAEPGETGCAMRGRGESVAAREAPGGKVAQRIPARQVQAALGANLAGDWLFTRAGWTSRAEVELLGDCANLPIVDPARAASGLIHFCPPGYAGYLRPRLRLGEGTAQVVSPRLANRLRARPDVKAEQIGEIPPRAVVDAVLDGPACAAPHVWWRVQIGERAGWTVESDIYINFYYLEPIAADAEAEPPLFETAPAASGRRIGSATASSIATLGRLPLEGTATIAWSADGASLAAIDGKGKATIFDMEGEAPTATAIAADDGHNFSALAFHPAGGLLALGSDDGAVALLALRDGGPAKDRLELGGLRGPVRALSFSPAGALLAAASGDESLTMKRLAGELKLWRLDEQNPARSQVRLHYSFPYPLTSLAFSADERLLAATGESLERGRAALWIYRSDAGQLVYDRPLSPMQGMAWAQASPAEELGDFIYASGDSLYWVAADAGEDRRFFHLAGALMPRAAFRPGVIPGAEAFFALATLERAGERRLYFGNALNPYAPLISHSLSASALAFSPDGRVLASAEPEGIRLLGIAAGEPSADSAA